MTAPTTRLVFAGALTPGAILIDDPMVGGMDGPQLTVLDIRVVDRDVAAIVLDQQGEQQVWMRDSDVPVRVVVTAPAGES